MTVLHDDPPVSVEPSRQAERVECRVEDAFAALESIRHEWDEFVLSVQGDIYMTFDWCRSWWEHYGAGRQLRIYLFSRGEAFIGIVPVCIETLCLGPVWLRVAKLVGSDSSLTICNPPAVATDAGSIWKHVLENLLRLEACDAVHIGPFSESSGLAAVLHEICAADPDMGTTLRDTPSGVHTVFELPDTFERYLKSLSKSQRGNYRRQQKLFDQQHQMDSDVITNVEGGVDEFQKFVKMHEAQWRAQGKLGHFRDWPGALAFNMDLVRRQAELGRLRMIRILADGEAVSKHYCFSFAKRCYWRLPARAIGSEWDKIGLGGLAVAKKVELCIVEGVREVEAGIGHYDYKIQWGGKERPLRSLLIARNTRSARLRAILFLQLADLLHLFYYRIWFQRVRPRIPFLRGPLWKCWIRSRI